MENGSVIGEDYFEHLLAEIREIRLSERRFYQKLTDIYATAVDYNADVPTTRKLFQSDFDRFTRINLLPLDFEPDQEKEI